MQLCPPCGHAGALASGLPGLDKVSIRDGYVSTRKSFIVEHGKSSLADA